MGLVELAPSGKAHLVPITILYDGEYYDASAYKAAPVPMALESGTVYEGFRTGVSLGLFTVTGALQGNNTWLGAGTWQSASALAAAKDAAAKKKAVMSTAGVKACRPETQARRGGSVRGARCLGPIRFGSPDSRVSSCRIDSPRSSRRRWRFEPSCAEAACTGQRSCCFRTCTSGS